MIDRISDGSLDNFNGRFQLKANDFKHFAKEMLCVEFSHNQKLYWKSVAVVSTCINAETTIPE